VFPLHLVLLHTLTLEKVAHDERARVAQREGLVSSFGTKQALEVFQFEWCLSGGRFVHNLATDRPPETPEM